MTTKVALVTGATGQDGALLTNLLLDKGYSVHGLQRSHHDSDVSSLHLHTGDLTDATGLSRLIGDIRPDEIYHLASQSHVKVSFDAPEYSANTDALSTLRLLEAIRIHGLAGKTRFYQAASSELFGNADASPQTETTPFRPRNPYAAAKLYAYWITVNYREAHGIHASNGILYNHEGPSRGEAFVTRKITKAVAALHRGATTPLSLGNLNSERDWGHARDYVQGMWMMLQQPRPDDYVLASGAVHSVRQFVETAFSHVGRTVRWQGEGVDEQGVDADTGQLLVRVDPRFFRPVEPVLLRGDADKARRVLGWTPKTAFADLVGEMVDHDVRLAEQTDTAAQGAVT